MAYDAILVVSFGGPEGPADVLPFLENVTRGRGIPAERLAEVAKHYEQFGGRSPLNDQTRALLAALTDELERFGHGDLPLYWGNRNWHPYLADTVEEMARDGVTNALAFVTSAYSSYSGCRQYLDDIAQARQRVGSSAPRIDKIRTFHDHPGFVATQAELVNGVLAGMAADVLAQTRLAFCAHSIPVGQADGCDYQEQLLETARLVVDRLDHQLPWDLVFQSRSGPQQVPWLEPDIVDHIDSLDPQSVRGLVLVPIGFLSDHLEVLYDLDLVAIDHAAGRGIDARRAPTVGVHPQFVGAVRLLIEERLDPAQPRLCAGVNQARPDRCPVGCCPNPGRATTIVGRPAQR